MIMIMVADMTVMNTTTSMGRRRNMKSTMVTSMPHHQRDMAISRRQLTKEFDVKLEVYNATMKACS
jgi:hypothetical protein